MNGTREETELVASRVEDWLEALQSDDQRVRTAFVQWLRESPVHVRELLVALELRDRLSHIDPERRIDLEALCARASEVVTFPAHSTRGAPDSPAPVVNRRSRRLWAWAATLLIAGALSWGAWLVSPVFSSGQEHETGWGEQRVITLADGSALYLDAQSEVLVRFSPEARDIDLRKGKALFVVQRDPSRPFRVHAAGSVIQAVGTQFEVGILRDRTIVSVLEGRVQVHAAPIAAIDTSALHDTPAPTFLEAGETASVAPEGRVSAPALIDPSHIGAWRQRRLVFHEATLAEIAAEFSRYARPLLRIEGAELQAERFTAVFDAQDPRAVVRFLQGDPDVTIEDHGDEIVIRAR